MPTDDHNRLRPIYSICDFSSRLFFLLASLWWAKLSYQRSSFTSYRFKSCNLLVHMRNFVAVQSTTMCCIMRISSLNMWKPMSDFIYIFAPVWFSFLYVTNVSRNPNNWNAFRIFPKFGDRADTVCKKIGQSLIS